MNCPNCNTTLLMTERNRIEIDYCPSCRGVWLDKGELDKMLEYDAQNVSYRQEEQPLSRPDPRYYDGKHKHPYGYQRAHKKKSFLGDLFDFD